MDKKAFKLRMQLLKNYRESNPGKTYVDFKAFSNGGETEDNSKLLFLQNWFDKRKQTGRFDKQLSLIEYKMLNARETDVIKSPQLIQKYIRRSGLPSNSKIGGYYDLGKNLIVLNDKEYQKDRDALLHEYTHSLKTIRPLKVIESIIDNTTILNRGERLNDYYTDPEEVYPRLMEFRKANNLDPLKIYGIPDVRQWRRSGKDANILDVFLDDDAVLDLINNVAAVPSDVKMYKDGGETPIEPTDPPYPNIMNGRRVNPYTGQQVATGLANAVFDIEDAANMTPIGDALTVKEMGESAIDKDWSGLGIASLGLIPVVGGGLYKGMYKKAKKSGVTQIGRTVPTVDKSIVSRQIDALEKQRLEKAKMVVTDETSAYNSMLSTIDGIDKKALNRAIDVDKRYGTKYEDAYRQMQLSKNNLEKLPDIKYSNGVEKGKPGANAMLSPNDDRSFGAVIEGEPWDMSMYDIKLNPDRTVTNGTINHEMGHLADLMASEQLGKIIPNNLFLKDLANPDNFLDHSTFVNNIRNIDVNDYLDYLHRGTEIKSFMNTTRRNLFDKGRINKMSNKIYLPKIRQYMNELPENNYEKLLFKSFKKPSIYEKYMNMIPITNKVDDKQTLQLIV